jgi:RNA polymerase sigma-70 factor (ECF subfamily)
MRSISKVYEKQLANTSAGLYNGPMEDAELIRRMLAHDKRAASIFYQTFAPKLLSFVRLKVTDPHEAEDIVQDTLFAFLEAIRDFHGNCRISTYLYAICRHKVIDYYRKKKIKQVIFSHAPEIEDILSPLLGPEETLDAVLLKEKLNKTLYALLPQYRYILRARYIFNMPIAEIAQKLTTTIKSAEMTLFRARKAFIRAYEK